MGNQKRKSQNNRQYNGQTKQDKRTNNDIRYTTHRTTRTPLNPEMNSSALQNQKICKSIYQTMALFVTSNENNTNFA